MMFVALAMFVRIFGKQGFVVAAFNQADQFCRTFRAFYLVAGYILPQNMYVIIHHLALAADEVFEGSVELDESYFGGRRKGRRGRGAAGKVVVFGILKRNGRVYTVVVDNAKSETLFPVIKKKIMPDSIVYTDSLSSYDKLDVSGFIHYRINHSKEFVDRQNHINGIENFWNQAKRFLRKYNGIDRKSFPLFLKECEFRFNFGTPSQQLKILRDWCGI